MVINERINFRPGSKGPKAASQSGRFTWFICEFFTQFEPYTACCNAHVTSTIYS